MNDHPPLAALTAGGNRGAAGKVLAPKGCMFLRGWRLAAAAAALCRVAAGAVVLGLFHPMSAANETNTGAEIRRGADEPVDRRNQRPHGQRKGAAALTRTPAAGAVRRGQCQGMEPTIWWGHRRVLPAYSGQQRDKRLYIASNAQVGPCYGYAVGRGHAQCGQRGRRSLLLCGYSVDPDFGHRHERCISAI